ncbi:MAG TPA: SIS domain-containing protein [Candidatus Saccharimonadales bacterium]|nr:SIS domain-containing protein [Candidatus Saccharimonadales bacterium]
MTRFAYDDQVASQGQAVAETLGSVEVPQLDRHRPLLFTGIGTSLHACRVAAYWVAELSGGRLRPAAIEAQDLALHGDVRSGDQIVVVSHRGTKRYPNAVLARAKEAGANTVTITGLGNPDPAGDVVLRTCADETAGTHSVSYLTALAVLGKLVARMLGSEASGFAAALDAVPQAIAATLALSPPTEVPKRLINREPILLTGHGIDEVTAEEAALKFKEGAYLWAEGMSQELAFHGTPAVLEPRMAAILIVPGREDGGRYLELQSLLLELGLEILTCGTGDTDLPFAEVAYLLRPMVAIVPLQRLVGELARRRGSNPDKIRGDVEPWASAIPKVRL